MKVSKSSHLGNWWETANDADTLTAAEADYAYLCEDTSRQDAYRLFSQIYANRDIEAEHSILSSFSRWNLTGNRYSRLPLNITKIVIDQVVSRIGSTRPRAVFLPSAGNATLAKKSKQMSRWVDFVSHATQIDSPVSRAVVDACVYGTGIVKIYKRPGALEVAADRVHPKDIFVDPAEAAYGQPKRILQRSYCSKHILKALFPDKADLIDKAGSFTDLSRRSGYEVRRDQVEVVEGWSLPSFPGAENGRRVLFFKGCLLEACEYTRDTFPFSFLNWKDDISTGFWGVGLTEELIGIHYDVNVSIFNIERASELTAKPMFLVEKNSKVNFEELSNAAGSIVTYSNTPPELVLPQSIPTDVFNYLQSQIARAFQIAGLSDQAAAGSRIPSGLETGQAVRDYHDIETQLFSQQLQRYERFRLNISENMVSTGRDIADYAKKEGKKFKVVLEKDKNTIEDVDWDTISLDPRKDSYTIKIYPVSGLSSLPSGRIDQVSSLSRQGLIDPQTARRLLDMPDLDAETTLELAPAHAIDRIIEKILDEGEYEPPEPFMDLRLALNKGYNAVNHAISMGVPEDRITLLRLFTTQVHDLLEQTRLATMQQQAGILPGQASAPAVGIDGAAITAPGVQ